MQKLFSRVRRRSVSYPALPAWRNKPGCLTPGLPANHRRLSKVLSSCTVANESVVVHHTTKRQKSFALSVRVPSFERDRPPGGPPLVKPQLNGGPARRAVNHAEEISVLVSDFLIGRPRLSASGIWTLLSWGVLSEQASIQSALVLLRVQLNRGARPKSPKPFSPRIMAVADAGDKPTRLSATPARVRAQ